MTNALKKLPVLLAGLVVLQACAYRMPVPRAPFELRLRIDVDRPTMYVVEVENAPDKGSPPFPAFSPLASTSKDASPAADGRVVVEVPSARGTCSVYFLDRIRVRGSQFTAYAVVVKIGPQTVLRISIANAQKLPVDDQGYHIVSLK